jgi:hypothetical protein
MDNLEELLNKEIQNNPGKYNQDTISRVTKLAKYISENMDSYTPYKLLRELSDFQLYYRIHPEWHGRSSSQMHKNKELGGINFYSAFLYWTKKESKGDIGYQKKLFYEIFPRKKIDWSNFVDVDDWKKYHDNIEDWIGKSPNEIRKDEKNAGHRFYCSFNKWTKKVAKNKFNYRLKLFQIVYGTEYTLHIPHAYAS